MTDLPDREFLAEQALTAAQDPDLAFCMGSWCGRHLATEDLAELVQYLEDCSAALERTAAARKLEEARLRLLNGPIRPKSADDS